MHKIVKLQMLFILLLLICHNSNAQTYNHYYGNIHSHTSYSDGNKDDKAKTPAQAYAYAKKSKHMDFLGVSEHNHKDAGLVYENFAKGLQQAKTANEDGKLVCLYGMEFGVINNGGHVLIYGYDEVIGWNDGAFDVECAKNDYSKLWEIVSGKTGTFATLAHPQNDHFNSLITKPYDEIADNALYGVAIANGPHSSTSTGYEERPRTQYYRYYQRLLAKGYKVGPTIDHDNHNTTFGRTSPGRTVILAQKLTRKDIIEAYKAMRFYASQDWNTQVNFTIGNKPIGSTIKVDKARLSVSITDPDAGDDVKTVKVLFGATGSNELADDFFPPETVNNFDYDIAIEPGESIYVYLEITQKDGDKIVTAPIWIESKTIEF